MSDRLSELLFEARVLPPCAVSEDVVRRFKDQIAAGLRSAGYPPKQSALGLSAWRRWFLLRFLSPDGKAASPDVVARLLVTALGRHPELLGGFSVERSSPVRTIHLLVVLDGEVVPFEYGGVRASNKTCGMLGAPPHAEQAVTSTEDFARFLAAAGLEPRLAERRRALAVAMQEAASAIGGEIVQDPALVEELAASLETAGAVAGRLAPDFLGLPAELVVAALRERLGAFAVRSAGELLPAFVAANARQSDEGGQVAAGYELAANSHLADVMHYYQRDCGLTLADRTRRLAARRIPDRSDTFGELSSRLASLVSRICLALGWNAEIERAADAAGLLYADSDCELVREFPSLRGTVAGLLAREEGYPATVWWALVDSSPLAVRQRRTPRGRLGKVVLLADLVDRLSTADVPAMRDQREHLLELIRLLDKADLRLDLDLLLALAADSRASASAQDTERSSRLRVEARAAFREYSGSVGATVDEFEAVLEGIPELDIGRCGLLQRFLVAHRNDRRLPMIAACAGHVSQIAGLDEGAQADLTVLREDSEIELLERCESFEAREWSFAADDELEQWLVDLVGIAEAVDLFRRTVLVRDVVDRLRAARLSLLHRVRGYLDHPVRWTRWQGELRAQGRDG